MSSVKTPNRPPASTSPTPSAVDDRLSSKTPRPAAPKQVRLKLVHIDFWSAVKFSILISVALGIVLVLAVLLVWVVLDSTGVFNSLSQLIGDVTQQKNFHISSVVSFAQVLGITLVLAALNVVVGTVLGAIACILYNLSVRISGGILVGFTNQ